MRFSFGFLLKKYSQFVRKRIDFQMGGPGNCPPISYAFAFNRVKFWFNSQYWHTKAYNKVQFILMFCLRIRYNIMVSIYIRKNITQEIWFDFCQIKGSHFAEIIADHWLCEIHLAVLFIGHLSQVLTVFQTVVWHYLHVDVALKTKTHLRHYSTLCNVQLHTRANRLWSLTSTAGSWAQS